MRFCCILLIFMLSICYGNRLKKSFTVINPVDLLYATQININPMDEEIISTAEQLPHVLYKSNGRVDDFFNDPCVLAIRKYVENMEDGKPYTLAMFDSWGKPESGILEGNLEWPGSYHECVDTNTSTFHGKYCFVTIGKTIDKNPFEPFTQVSVRVGGCFPSVCTNNNISSILSFINTNLTLDCPTQYVDWKSKDIAALVVCGVLLALVVSASIYEFAVTQMSEEDSIYQIGSQPSNDTSKIYQAIISFSIIANTRKLFKTKAKQTDIHCLHGMRFISITWVILGHSLLLLFNSSDNPKAVFKYIFEHWEVQGIINGGFSVDTFFFLSGLLVAYLTYPQFVNNNGKINVLKMYFNRYMRLTPSYAFILFFSVTLYLKFGEGPLWPQFGDYQLEQCGKYWYTNLLYVNNLYPANQIDECYVVSWYLANDFQFYLLAPMFLYILYRSPWAGLGVLSLIVTLSMAITGAFTNITNQQPTGEVFGLISAYVSRGNLTQVKPSTFGDPSNFYTYDIYAKPWCRIGAYVIGMKIGYFLHQYKGEQLKIPKVFVAFLWLTSTAVSCSLLYCLYPSISRSQPLPINVSAFYNAVSRPLWCACLSWVTIACVHGYGGPVNAFLSWKGFIPLSRLTYGCYLLHPLAIWWLIASSERLLHFSVQTYILVYISSLVVTIMAAYVVAMLVEFPFVELINIWKNKQKKNVSFETLSNEVTDVDDENEGALSSDDDSSSQEAQVLEATEAQLATV